MKKLLNAKYICTAIFLVVCIYVATRDYGNSLRLNAEIIIFLFCIYLISMVVLILKEKKLINVKTVTALIISIVFMQLFFHALSIGPTVKTDTIKVNGDTVTALLDGEERIKQQIHPEETLRGIMIKFATYGKTPEAFYVLTLYDENNNVLENVYFDGKKIKDNEYLTIGLANEYKSGMYYFSVRSTEICDDTVSVWRGSTDDYPGGNYVENGVVLSSDLDFNLVLRGPDTKIYVIITMFIVYILGMAVLFADKIFKDMRKPVAIIYVTAAALSLFMMIFTWKNLFLGTYDEMAHLSYLADVTENPSIIPDYENQVLLANDYENVPEEGVFTTALTQNTGMFVGKKTDTVSFLGHPPLYYQVLKCTNSVKIDKSGAETKVYANLNRLRVANIVLVMSGLLIYMYIGFTRIDKKYPVVHLLYAFTIALFPMLYGCAPTINNDNIAIIITGIFTLGIIRFIEDKRNCLTYSLIAIGIVTASMTKVTVCAMLVICALIFVVASVIREKDWKKVFNKSFMITAPIYLVAAVFYGFFFMKYGKIQVSLRDLVSDEVFTQYALVYVEPSERLHLSFREFIEYFLNNFLKQWSSGITFRISKEEGFFRFSRIAFNLLWFSPIVAFSMNKGLSENEKRMSSFYKAFSVSLIITVILQVMRGFNDFYFISGHAGVQSRYYICVMPVMALVVSHKIQQIMNKDLTVWGKTDNNSIVKVNDCISSIVTILSYAAIYGGCVYYFLGVTNYML